MVRDFETTIFLISEDVEDVGKALKRGDISTRHGFFKLTFNVG